MASHGKWTTLSSRVYYLLGSAFYIHQWLLALGVVSWILILSDSFLRYLAPALSIGCLSWGAALWRKSVSAKLSSPNPALSILSQDVKYHEIDEHSCESIRKLIVRASSPVNQYKTIFNWSGNGKCEVEARKGIESCELHDQRNGGGRVCKLNFGRAIAPKKSHEFEFVYHLKEATVPLKHYFTHLIATPVKSLVLRVVPLESLKVIAFRKQILVSPGSEFPIWEEDVPLQAGQKELVWVIPKPAIGFHYQLTWGLEAVSFQQS